jgi:hypothetical protein
MRSPAPSRGKCDRQTPKPPHAAAQKEWDALYVPDQAAFVEDIGPFALRDVGRGAGDALLEMTQAISWRGIEPVDASGDRMADGEDEIAVILVAQPTALSTPSVGMTNTN